MTDWPLLSPLPTLEMERISTSVLAAPATSISITGIAAAYVTFEIVAYWLKDANAGLIAVRLNNDSGANYYWQYILSNTASGLQTGAMDNAATYLLVHAAQSAANTPGSMHAHLSKPTAGSRASGICVSGCFNGDIQSAEMAWDWSNTTDLINRIDLISVTNNIATGSRMALGGARVA